MNKDLKKMVVMTGSVTAGIVISFLFISLFIILIVIVAQTPVDDEVKLSGNTKSINELKALSAWILRDCAAERNASSDLQTGSGILWSLEGNTALILTNRHVLTCSNATLQECEKISPKNTRVRLGDGNMYNISSTSLAPEKLDVALLSIDFSSTPNLNYSLTIKNRSLSLGEKVIAVSYPGFSSGVVEFIATEGRVSSLHDLLTPTGFLFKGITSNAAASFGSSGGGLFDKEGSLAGIISWGREDGSEITAIDIHSLKPLLDKGSLKVCE